MRYGYFDNDTREYVIQKPDTPMSWINYLGTSEYCAILSNQASGYSFYRSPKSGRLLRFRFNSIPQDRPGRYIYLRDNRDGDYWSATWQPVGKPLDVFHSECRHGLGYSRFLSEYRQIKTQFRVFVPLDKPIELWELDVENTSSETMDLSLFTYCEWCFWDMNQDMANFQYILYTCQMACENDILDYSISLCGNRHPPKAFLSSSLPVVGFDTDRDSFIGRYRDESNPIAVEKGTCSNSIAIGGNPCGSIQNRLSLRPGEKKHLLYILGVGNAQTDGVRYRDYYRDPLHLATDFKAVQSYWNARLGGFTCQTPDAETNTMANIWNQYQCHTTFNWSRSASFNEAGLRDGLGYRDSNQDTLGVVHAIPELVKAKLQDLLKGQLAEGYAMHSIQPLTWVQGRQNIPDRSRIYSDDHLWLLISIPAYLKETGDFDFLDAVLPFADQGEATVWEHLKRALEFSWANRGRHGLLLGLAADWNDCINLKGKGESVWSSFLFYKCLAEYVALAEKTKRTENLSRFNEWKAELRASLNRFAWDGEWYLRGYLDQGEKLGGHNSEQAKIFINSQTWSVISGVAEEARGKQAMKSLDSYLFTEYGVLKCFPSFTKPDDRIGAVTYFPKGLKENGSIFCHADTWAVIAAAMLGDGDTAFRYYRAFLPAAQNDHADRYTMEPYVYAQFITGKEHPYHFGRARNSWLTGTASWSFVAISQYILGIRADYDGLVIDPAVPHTWARFSAQRVFRGHRFHLEFSNPRQVSHGVQSLTLNGEKLSGNRIPLEKMKQENDVQIILG